MNRYTLSISFLVMAATLRAQYDPATGNYQWHAPKNFNLIGNSEWSFDFSAGTQNGLWHVWDPTLGPILSVRNTGRIGLLNLNPAGLLDIDAGDRQGMDGKLLLRSSSGSYGQIQILNPTSEEASIAFIARGSGFGQWPTSADGHSRVWVMGTNAWGGGGDIFAIGNNQYAIDHGDGKLLTIKSTGEVGIGTAPASDAKLTVKGEIHTTSVKVSLEGALAPPDYVFEEDYDMMTLSEVEAFIEDNKHLPEVPSAKEMLNEGIKLEEMNLTLLKKIEELTLYVIEQKKTIDDLERRLKEVEVKD